MPPFKSPTVRQKSMGFVWGSFSLRDKFITLDILMLVHISFIFSSPELKAQVSFSDHLSSVVCLSILSVRL